MRWLWLWAVVLCLPIAGCGADAGRPWFTIENRSGKPIKHLVVFNAGKALNFRGIDANDSDRLRAVLDDDLPDEIVVTWELANGQTHHEKVRLTSALGATYFGPVRITIDRSMQVRATRG